MFNTAPQPRAPGLITLMLLQKNLALIPSNLSQKMVRGAKGIERFNARYLQNRSEKLRFL